jgi:hypothetical protein
MVFTGVSPLGAVNHRSDILKILCVFICMYSGMRVKNKLYDLKK